jgi:hypothetical protein
MKIADKADMMARNKNLEGNNPSYQNSFAVLDTLTLVNNFSKMGGNSNTVNLEHFDILKDLEMARNNMKERLENLNKEADEAHAENFPLEEMKYIEWRSYSSDLSDIEGLQVVSKRKKEKQMKEEISRKSEQPQGTVIPTY